MKRPPFLLRDVSTSRADSADLAAIGRLGDLLLAVVAVGFLALLCVVI